MNTLKLTEDMHYVASSDLIRSIYNAGGTAYFVGGCVRDLIRGKQPDDIDLVVCYLTRDRLSEIVTKHYPNADMVGKSFGVYKCDNLDIAHARTDRQTGDKHTDVEVYVDPTITIEEDLLRRDFTMNAIAINTRAIELTDPYNGVRDIEHRVIRAVDETAFTDDPLRIVRAFQFKSRFGYRLSPNTLDMIKSHYFRIMSLPGERILEELKKVYDKGDPEQFVHDTSGVLFHNGIAKKYPRTFEDFIYQLYGSKESNLKEHLSIDSYTAKATQTLHTSFFESKYEMLPIIVDKYPQLLESAYLSKALKTLNKLCVSKGAPRTFQELKDFTGIDGEYFIQKGFKGPEIGKLLKEELKSIQKEIYESRTIRE